MPHTIFASKCTRASKPWEGNRNTKFLFSAITEFARRVVVKQLKVEGFPLASTRRQHHVYVEKERTIRFLKGKKSQSSILPNNYFWVSSDFDLLCYCCYGFTGTYPLRKKYSQSHFSALSSLYLSYCDKWSRKSMTIVDECISSHSIRIALKNFGMRATNEFIFL